VVVGRFACGHTETNVFPQAPARTSRREIAEWMFGPRRDERCARCQRQARAARSAEPACSCASRRRADRPGDDCPASIHVAEG
jgi:hypothetical protein